MHTCAIIRVYSTICGTSLASALRYAYLCCQQAAAGLELTGDKHIDSKTTHTHEDVNRTMSQTQTHTDSVDGQDHDEVQKKAKSRRPASKLTTSTPPKHG